MDGRAGGGADDRRDILAAREQRDGGHQQHAENGRLQHGAQHVLAGDAGLQVPRVVLRE